MSNKRAIIKVKNKLALREIEIAFGLSEYAVFPENGVPADLLVYEITDNDTAAQFAYLKNALTSGAVRDVFLVSGSTDPGVLIQALKVGSREFFPLPLKSVDLYNALKKRGAETSSAPDAEAKTEKPIKSAIIHVLGSKGGAGATTISVNLARGLADADRGKKVALIDLNVLFGDVAAFVNLQPPFPDWSGIAKSIARLDSSLLMDTLRKHSEGLYILPAPIGLIEASVSGTDIARKLLTVMKSVFDYVVVDGGQDLGDISRTIMGMADHVLLVTQLNLSGLVNIRRLKDVFARLGYPAEDRLFIVGNRVNRRSVSISLEDAQRTIKKRIDWTVPNDFVTAMNAINAGRPLADIAPGSEIAQSIGGLAARFVKNDASVSEPKKTGLFESFRNAMTRVPLKQ